MKNLNRFSILFMAVLLIISACKRKDIDENCKICGKIAESNNTAIDSVKIEILESGKAIPVICYTSATGEYCFDNLEPNAYSFTLSKKGYTMFQQIITVENAQQEKNFTLVKIIALFGKDTIVNIMGSEATANGFFTNLGFLGAVTQHGHCWSPSSSTPTIYDSHTMLGSLNHLGPFSSSMTGLSPNTIYYVRAYATNSIGIAYSDPISFITTSSNLPAVSTAAVSSITQSTISCGGNISNDGGYPITSRGVCWSTTSNPVLSGSHTTNGSGVGAFTSILTGLSVNTEYYVRAYATNNVGTAYGNEVTVTIWLNQAGPQVTDFDGNTYNSVKIGEQIWMKENLKVTHYRNGTALPLVSNDNTWNTLTSGAYCNYNHDINNAATYGRLYNYYAVIDTRNISPVGWHVPSDDDWKVLVMFLGLSQTEADAMGWKGTDQGGRLKESGTSHWSAPNTGATNATGFNALPAGNRSPNDGLFYSLNTSGYWWTTSSGDPTVSWYYLLVNNKSQIAHSLLDVKYGLSVRCVKD